MTEKRIFPDDSKLADESSIFRMGVILKILHKCFHEDQVTLNSEKYHYMVVIS